MAGTLTPAEQAQLQQTIDMFQVIVDSQPLDYQSLEILKEAYLKLGMQTEAIDTSKKIAEAYVQLGQLSSAIMEYETILQQFPEDTTVKEALEKIESKTTSFQGAPGGSGDPNESSMMSIPGPLMDSDIDDGKLAMKRIFVDGKLVAEDDFNRYWSTPSGGVPGQIETPFIKLAAEKIHVNIDEAAGRITAKAKCGFIPIERYDVDMEYVRTFPKEVCQKWCVIPFDRLSKSVMVATTNPFNKEAEKELRKHTKLRVIWYFAMPDSLIKLLKKIYR